MGHVRGRRDAGASSVEYALIVVAIAAVIVIVVASLGLVTKHKYDTTCNNLSAKMDTSASC